MKASVPLTFSLLDGRINNSKTITALQRYPKADTNPHRTASTFTGGSRGNEALTLSPLALKGSDSFDDGVLSFQDKEFNLVITFNPAQHSHRGTCIQA
ncbi:MAG: hypothetical protein JWQ71_2316 [Pedosphaera sp.]|nr:hypothetical protein [Pedosphaera sp.]